MSDEQFNEWILKNMQLYVRAKLEKGYKFRFKESFPAGLRMFSAKKQINFKIKKRFNADHRHGHSLVKDIINGKREIGPELFPSKQAFQFDLESTKS